MIKHILTKECNRKCSYCISRNIKEEQCRDIRKVAYVYEQISYNNDSIMLTGGEPTLAYRFEKIVSLASQRFKNIYLTTQNPEILTNDYITLFFKAITFSLHDEVIPEIGIEFTPVYASILDFKYREGLVDELKCKGYRGLTINEEQREGKEFITNLPGSTDDFTIRINRKGKCLDDTILLPDLQIINDYRRYL